MWCLVDRYLAAVHVLFTNMAAERGPRCPKQWRDSIIGLPRRCLLKMLLLSWCGVMQQTLQVYWPKIQSANQI